MTTPIDGTGIEGGTCFGVAFHRRMRIRSKENSHQRNAGDCSQYEDHDRSIVQGAGKNGKWVILASVGPVSLL